jgi:hypothetical protein
MVRVPLKHTSVRHFRIVVLKRLVGCNFVKKDLLNLRPSAVRGHGQFGTRYLLLSAVLVAPRQCIGNTVEQSDMCVTKPLP